MKKRKILYLFPLAALLLSGCSFQEAFKTAKSWVGHNVYYPFKSWINNEGWEDKSGEKEEKGGEDGGETQKTVTEITHVYAPADVDKDYVFTVQDVTVDVAYSDGTTGNIRPDSVALDTSEPGEVTGTVTVGEVSAQFTVTVNAPVEVETYTPEEVIAKCDEAGANVVTELLQVRGEVAVGMVKNSYGWTGSFICEGEKVLTFDSIKTEESFEGKIVTIQGYAELYEGAYKVGYLPPAVSPTEEAYEPVLVSVEDAPAKVITAITNVTGPQQVYVDTVLTAQDFILDVEFEGGKTGQVRPDSVSGDTSEPGEAVPITLTAGSVQVVYNIKVVPQPVSPVHAGTLEDPYTVSDAKLIFDGLADGEIGGECYVTGTIANTRTPSVSGGRGRFDLTDGLCDTNLYVYNVDKIGGGTGVTVDDIPVGAVVVAKGTIKNYGGTFELCYNKENPAISCELISVVKPTILVSGITLSSTEENIFVGYADLTLTATVTPSNASNSDLAWSSSNEAVATVENGVVHAVAEGDAVITAAATDGSGIDATCTVHVAVPEATVTGVVVSVLPKTEYTEGDLLDLSAMELTVTKSDSSVEEHVTTGYTTNIALDHELTTEDTSLVVTYGGVDAEPIALTVTPKPQPVHAGTVEDPYTVSDAKIVFDDLADGEIGGECYVTGTITAESRTISISSGRGRFDITDGVCESNLYVYNVNNIGGSNDLTLADIPEGSVIVAKGTIKNYSGTFEFCYNQSNPSIACELISVDKPVIIPASVTISGSTSVQEEKTITLTAEVGPVGAPQDVVWSVEAGSEYASVDQNGVVTGIAPGSATIRATAVDHSDVYGEYGVTVTAKPTEPTEQEVYALTPASGSNNGYAGNCDIAINGVTWNLTGNSTMQPWRIGGKSLTGVDRTLYSKTAMADDISKIEVQHGGASSITVNSWTLVVSQNDDFSDPVSTMDLTFAANSTTTITRPADTDWSNCYFKFVYNLTVSGTSNKFVEFTGASFYAVK